MDNPENPQQILGEGRWVDFFHQRVKDREFMTGMSLSVPIVLMYVYGLSTLESKTTWLIATSLTILVFFVAAISLDLEVGSVGLPNFGKVAFIAIGAYASTILYNVFNVFFPIAVLISLLISASFGYIISIPAVKLRADYFAIMTIAGGEVIRLILLYEERWLWAPLPPPIPAKTQLISSDLKIEFTDQWYPFKLRLSEYTPYDITIFRDIGRFIEDSGWGPVFVWEITLLIVFIIISLITYWFVQQIRKSPYGRTLRAIREDDITVTSVGKDVARFRWQVTTISALLCGMAGVMYAIAFGALDAADFRPEVTFQLYMFIIIGGLGNSRGAFIGTTLVTLFLRGAQVPAVKDNLEVNFSPESPLFGPILDFLQLNIFINPFNLRFVVLGGILILFLLFMPAGLIPEPRTDNERYLTLLSSDERIRSDEAVLARQSLAEKERIKAEERSQT